ncbi:patatin family protein [Gluconacetobacter azotocaptans]|uniref:Patatin family protein n=1 Tax=Gluconacetobacter azotocaptans TaxID=142834 RepID=A0A7W4PG07_9PROT|nr:patatin-like phospholipase family protein [Gluconacetobacter azotocaptans]MBB2191114.1 patatin family protein [Gluconacetobacter azotocaptans]MBM9402275.1 patatin-like phospholipase family protein [Gluconacetobacter azotocaptans]
MVIGQHSGGGVHALQSRRSLFGLAGGGAAAALLAGCSFPMRGTAVPLARTLQASVLGLPNERFFPFYGTGPLEIEVMAALERMRVAQNLASTASLPELQLLAVSGGGENGAFGAGLLCGWSERGTRPTFELVTGVSTGALTAPFAYLGSSYDGPLRAVYTELTPAHVLLRRFFTAAFFNDAMSDNAPLFKTISTYLDENMLNALAKAYAGGRLLFVGTTNLDAQQPVIWNIGAIAGSGHPRALDTIRRILLASSAIPGAFPPTMFNVVLDGKPYQEMHVDGGAFAQAFLYPSALTRQRRLRMASGQHVLSANAYIIRNGRLDPEWATTERRTLGIAGRAIATMITASGINDVIRLYNTTRHDDIGYNLAYIGSDFDLKPPKPFDQKYMRALFDYGYRRGRAGYPWAKAPPI